MNTRLFVLAACVGLSLCDQVRGADAYSGPLRLNVNTNGVKTISWPRPLIPALETNRLTTGTRVTGMVPVPSNLIAITTNDLLAAMSAAGSPFARTNRIGLCIGHCQ